VGRKKEVQLIWYRGWIPKKKEVKLTKRVILKYVLNRKCEWQIFKKSNFNNLCSGWIFFQKFENSFFGYKRFLGSFLLRQKIFLLLRSLYYSSIYIDSLWIFQLRH